MSRVLLIIYSSAMGTKDGKYKDELTTKKIQLITFGWLMCIVLNRSFHSSTFCLKLYYNWTNESSKWTKYSQKELSCFFLITII